MIPVYIKVCWPYVAVRGERRGQGRQIERRRVRSSAGERQMLRPKPAIQIYED